MKFQGGGKLGLKSAKKKKGGQDTAPERLQPVELLRWQEEAESCL